MHYSKINTLRIPYETVLIHISIVYRAYDRSQDKLSSLHAGVNSSVRIFWNCPLRDFLSSCCHSFTCAYFPPARLNERLSWRLVLNRFVKINLNLVILKSCVRK